MHNQLSKITRIKVELNLWQLKSWIHTTQMFSYIKCNSGLKIATN